MLAQYQTETPGTMADLEDLRQFLAGRSASKRKAPGKKGKGKRPRITKSDAELHELRLKNLEKAREAKLDPGVYKQRRQGQLQDFAQLIGQLIGLNTRGRAAQGDTAEARRRRQAIAKQIWLGAPLKDLAPYQHKFVTKEDLAKLGIDPVLAIQAYNMMLQGRPGKKGIKSATDCAAAAYYGKKVSHARRSTNMSPAQKAHLRKLHAINAERRAERRRGGLAELPFSDEDMEF